MKGSYTVEVSWIMAMSLSVICSVILVAFGIFEEVVSEVSAPIIDVDVVALFYQRVRIKEFLEGFR